MDVREEDVKYETDKDGHVYRSYEFIKTRPIERFHYQNAKIDAFIKSQVNCQRFFV